MKWNGGEVGVKQIQKDIFIRSYEKGCCVYIEEINEIYELTLVELTKKEAVELAKFIMEELNICPHCFEIIKGNRCYCMADD